MSDGRWQHLCVVGLGGHARTKIIPAILANGQRLAGVVTRGEAELPVETPRFSSVAGALAALPPDTAFVIASPPPVHFDQVMAVLAAGRDAIVEKPAFASAAEAEAAVKAAGQSGALLVEAFMNRHTLTHRRFLADWTEQRPAAVEFTFTIPATPPGTFRSDPAIAASSLYDMGCYLLAALTDAGLSLDGLALDRVDNAGQPDRELLHLTGTPGGIAVQALVGVATDYVNRLRLIRPDGGAFAYSPFIYGRPGPRRIVTGQGEVEIDDVNAFEAMFAVPRGEWRQRQPERLERMVEIARQLERLGVALERARRGS